MNISRPLFEPTTATTLIPTFLMAATAGMLAWSAPAHAASDDASPHLRRASVAADEPIPLNPQWLHDRVEAAARGGHPDAEHILTALERSEPHPIHQRSAERLADGCLHTVFAGSTDPINDAHGILKCEEPIDGVLYYYVDMIPYGFAADEYPTPETLTPLAKQQTQVGLGRRGRPVRVDLEVKSSWPSEEGAVLIDSLGIFVDDEGVFYSYTQTTLAALNGLSVFEPSDTQGNGDIEICLSRSHGCDVTLPPSDDGHLYIPFEAALDVSGVGATSVSNESKAKLILHGDSARVCFADPAWFQSGSFTADGTQLQVGGVLDFGPECYLPDAKAELSLTLMVNQQGGGLSGGTWIPSEAVKLKGQPTP